MTVVAKIETGTMTSKGQVLIPKAFRDAAGLVPGQPYRMSIDDEGRVIVAPIGISPEEGEARAQRVRAALLAVAGKYPNPDGASTDVVMRELRGDYAP